MATDDNYVKTGDTYEVIKATTRPLPGLELDGKRMRFDGNDRLRVRDRGKALALRSKYGRDITVTRIEDPHPSDRGHRYTFTNPGVPWAKYDEFGRRIKEQDNGTIRPDHSSDRGD